jgi:hypothetical protein
MKKILLLLVVLFNIITTFAQTEQLQPVEKKWIVKWNNTAAIDAFSFPTVQFAVERKINSYFSVQTEAGIQAYSFRNSADTLSVSDSGFKVMAEGRFYLFNYLKKDKTKRRKSDGVYTGIQFFYRKNSYNERLDYFRDEISYDNHENMISDDFGIKKEVYGINLCLGYQIPIHNFVLEPYVYIGGFKRNIKNFNRDYDESLGHIEKDDPHPWVVTHDKKEKSGSGENFSLGLRIGYKF